MKIIAIGDSFTFGFGVKKSESWISLLARELSNYDITLVNKGINGDTTSGILSRFYRDVVDETPRYAIITGGINDLISGSGLPVPKSNYMSLIHQAYHNNIIPVIGVEPFFKTDTIRESWSLFGDFAKVEREYSEFRDYLYSLSRTFNIFLLDFSRELRPEHLSDGLHLTTEGHRLASKTAFEFMKLNVIR